MKLKGNKLKGNKLKCNKLKGNISKKDQIHNANKLKSINQIC
jgi:hypothetical protein